MSRVTSKIDHESEIGADVACVTYKWSLHHWSLLSDHYKTGVFTPYFDVAKGEDCRCRLSFSHMWKPVLQSTFTPFGNNQVKAAKVGGQDPIFVAESAADIGSPGIKVQFVKSLDFHSMRASVSLVNKNMTRLLTSQSPVIKSLHDVLSVTLDGVSSEKSLSFYLQDDTLIMLFELHIVRAVNEVTGCTSAWDSSLSNVACDRLRSMYETGQFCDVTFCVQEQTFPAHKVVLAANSDVFEAMFSLEMKEQLQGVVDIPDIDAEVFRTFLKYLYTGKVENIEDVVNELMIAANKYHVTDLVKLCETYMITHLTVANVTQYMLTAHLHERSHLVEQAINFMKSNTKFLADPTSFKLLSAYPELIARIFA